MEADFNAMHCFGWHNTCCADGMEIVTLNHRQTLFVYGFLMEKRKLNIGVNFLLYVDIRHEKYNKTFKIELKLC